MRELIRGRWRMPLFAALIATATAACSDDPAPAKADAGAELVDADPDAQLDDGADDTAGDTTSDQDADDAGKADDAPDDPDADCRQAGCACSGDTHCYSGKCVDLGAGPQCQPPTLTLCAPCLTDTECQVVAADAACLDYGAVGSFCGFACTDTKDCPTGYTCNDAKDRQGATVKQCQPAENTACKCSQYAIDTLAATLCQDGLCPGERSCLPDIHPNAPAGGGLGKCNPTGGIETCDGLDNDCNGKADDGQPCDDANPCTDDSCAATGCTHTPAIANCEDGDACTEGDACKDGACKPGDTKTCKDATDCTLDTCDAKLGCTFTPDDGACNDNKPCTTDTCDPSKGCTSTPLPQCDPAFVVPHKESFACASKTAAKWQLTGAPNGPQWALDKSPDPPGYASSDCSLNFNDGKTFDCPKGATSVSGTATTPWFFDTDHKPGHGLQLKLKLSGDWEKPGADDLDLEITTDGKHWQTLGGFSWTDITKWSDEAVDLHEWAGKPLRIRFRFHTLDCVNNAYAGPFIDDFELVSVPCAVKSACDDGNPCTIDTCSADKGCAHTPDPKCPPLRTVPYATDFACGGLASKDWQLENAQTSPGWGLDAVPFSPGYASPPCSLNFNDGKNYACKSGDSVAGDASSPRLDATAYKAGDKLFARFKLGGEWEDNEYDNLELWATVDGTDWQQLTSWDSPKKQWQDVSVDVSAYAGKVFSLSFSFWTSDCEENSTSGPFVDDLTVAPGACLSDDQCGDGDPCTNDSCKQSFGCQHTAHTGNCDDGDPCTLAGTCKAGKCDAKAVACDDDDKCTTDSCIAGKGCKFSPIDGCGAPLKLPIHDDFACGTVGVGKWRMAPETTGTTGAKAPTLAAWDIDGTPSPPGFSSPLCSLNFNDGKAYECALGQDHVQGTATSHWIDLTAADKGAKTLLRFKLAGTWEQGAWDRLRVYASDDPNAGSGSGKWTELAELEHAAPYSWDVVELDLAAFSGTRFRLRFAFETLDCVDNASVGPFIDDLSLTVPACKTKADCDDNNPCTDEVCEQTGACTRINKTGSCADGDKCKQDPICQAGVCTGPARSCDDGSPCTIDSCTASQGCRHKPVQGCGGPIKLPYDEPFECQTLSSGAWELTIAEAVTPAGAPAWALDASPNPPGFRSKSCSLNLNNGQDFACGVGQLQVAAAATSLWLDGKSLTPGDDLRLRFYVAGGWETADFDKLTLIISTDGNTWTTLLSINHNQADAWTEHEVKLGAYAGSNFKIAFYFETADCIDNAATGPFIDDLSVYVAGCESDLACDDANVCTVDLCAAVTATGASGGGTCVHQLNSGSCSDGDLCTDADTCTNGACVGSLKTCEDDNNPCTTIACDPNIGCATKLSVGSCDDGDPCTTGDTCKKAVCTGKPATCDDANACTADSCNPQNNGCNHSARIGPCDDGDACSEQGTCKDGVCKSAPKCDDGNPCSKNTCDTKTGKCASTLFSDGTFCDDGDTCSNANKCTKGVCGGGVATCDCTDAGDCKDDGNPCTQPACSAGKCGKTVATDGASCDDNNACTKTTTCQTAVCTPQANATTDCADGNPCTADLCDAKTGKCSHPPLNASCDDGNKCTANDACADGSCKGQPLDCTDDNRCTNDSCDAAKGCEHTPLSDGSKCNDDDACTAGDTCQKAVCTGKKTTCDDNNPCTNTACTTVGGCAYGPVTGKCDDGNPCTSADACDNSICDGKPTDCDDRNPCTLDTCDTNKLTGNHCQHAPAQGGCDDNNACTVKDACKAAKCAGDAKVCDDNKACTVDVCDAKTGACSASVEPDGGPCDDNNPCTFVDACNKGVCVGEAKPCNDDLPCTADGCDDKGVCTHKTLGDGQVCEDGNPCTSGDICQSGVCVGGKKDCNDGDLCSVDTCETTSGACVHGAGPDKVPCSDGKLCTSNDSCQKGKCTGAAKDCGDGKACTLDLCDGATAKCSHKDVPDGGGCDDGNACTVQELCKSGVCAGIARVCDDNNGCTTDSCETAKGGCQFTPISGAKTCDDGSACTSKDACKDGVCTGTASDCDDKNPCTADVCQAATGKCLHPAASDGGVCDDGNKCTTETACVGGGCIAGKVKTCGDATMCAANSCDPLTGDCKATGAAGTACDDGNPCTHNDKCSGGTTNVCKGAAKACDDGDPCTLNLCNGGNGTCINAAHDNGQVCDDHNPCTSKDSCQGGSCTGQPKSCDDAKACTLDACGPTGACKNLPIGNGQACSDGDACTAQDTCQGGTCSGIKQICADGGPCMTGVCNSKSGGCGLQAKTDGTACDDQSGCTTDDKCDDGACAGKDKPCDDGKPCTHDACDPATGACTSTPSADGVTCDDGDPCTVGEKCEKSACKGVLNPCEDGNPCTKGTCDKTKAGAKTDPSAACTQTPTDDGATCEDGSACTTADTCKSGACVGTTKPCDDKAPCLVGTCNPKTAACDYTATGEGKTCDDKDACTGNDACSSGLCGGKPKVCNDANPCTADSCDSKSGGCATTPTNNGGACTDGDACTTVDVCNAGACKGALKACNDGNSCTADACDKATGQCTNTAASNGTSCDDNNACTDKKTCQAGACSGVDKDCTGTKVCTAYSCDPSSGCTTTELTGCGSAVSLPYTATFICDGPDKAAWQLDSGTPGWAIDGTPKTPGFASPSCSLNFNDGTDYACAPGAANVGGAARSPWFDASKVAKGSVLMLRLRIGGAWEGAPHDALLLFADVDGQSTPLSLGTLASPGGAFAADPVAIDLSTFAGKRFALRLQFGSDDCSNNNGSGPFIDDLFVGVVQCVDNGQCKAGQICVVGTCQEPPKSAPDLVVSKLDVLTKVLPGEQATFSVTVTNKGDKDAPDAFKMGFSVNSKADGNGAQPVKFEWDLGGIAAGASRVQTGWFKLGAANKPGTWHLLVNVDAQNTVAERDESNNVASESFQLLAAPKGDLSWLTLTADAAVQAGAELTINHRADNKADGDIGASRTAFYLSKDIALDGGDLALGSVVEPAIKAKQQGEAKTSKLSVPAGVAAGDWFVLGRLDVGNELAETDEANNVSNSAIKVTAAKNNVDLHATLLAPKSSPLVAGDKLEIALGWRNDGNSGAAAFTDSVTISKLDGSGKVTLSEPKRTGLGAGKAGGETVEVTVPAGLTSGDWLLTYTVDSGDAVSDSDRKNNTIALPVTVIGQQGGPDLVSLATSAAPVDPTKSTLAAGDELRFLPGMGCKNVGKQAAAEFYTRVVWSKNPLLSGADVAAHPGSYKVAGGLAVDASWGPWGNTWQVPADLAPGDWYVGVLCDSGNVVAETDESNNAPGFLVKVVGRADLVVDLLQPSAATVQAGGSLTVRTAARNQGSAGAAARTDTLYLSTNSAITAADTKLGEVKLSGLGAGSFDAAATTSITIPAGTKPGTLYIGVALDTGSVVAESDEANNSKAVAITITDTAPVAITGRVTYDRVPALGKDESGPRLGLDKIKEQPARRVVVQALDAADGKTVLAETTTDDDGKYTLLVPAAKSLKIRANAWLRERSAVPDGIGADACKGAAWEVKTVDNTASRAMYAIESPALTGGKDGWDLHAAVAHSGTAYTARAGAPFGLTDDVLSVLELLCQGQPDAKMPLLYMNWSVNNARVAGDVTKGEIGIPHYSQCGVKADGACVSAIFMAGRQDFDADEWDDHITGHEAGHFVEAHYFRSDNPGGSHSVGHVVDVGMAWGEGYGTVFGALALGDPVFVDTSGKAGQKGWQLDLDEARPAADRGIYSELATARLVYLLWDRRNGVIGDGIGSFDRAFEVMKSSMAPGPSYVSPLAFGAYYNARFGGKAEDFQALWQGDFNTPYDALCVGSCKGTGDVADPFDSDNDIGKAYAPWKVYPDPWTTGAKTREAGFWRLYEPLGVGTHNAGAHDVFVTAYKAPDATWNKVGTNRHYRLTGTGKSVTVRVHDVSGAGCGGDVKMYLWAYTVDAPRTKRQLGASLAACPAVTFETDKDREYLIKLHGAYKVGTGWSNPGGPEADLGGWSVTVTEN